MSMMENPPLEQPSDKMATRRTKRRREYVVARVCAADAPISERELATGFVANQSIERSRPRSAVQVSLRHRDLPKLEAAGLVSWDRTEKTVAEPAETHGSNDGRTDTTAVLDELGASRGTASEDRRRRVVDVLGEMDEPIDARDLARELLTDGGEPSSDAVESMLSTLHHVDLPTLEADGCVEYDAAECTVVPRLE